MSFFAKTLRKLELPLPQSGIAPKGVHTNRETMACFGYSGEPRGRLEARNPEERTAQGEEGTYLEHSASKCFYPARFMWTWTYVTFIAYWGCDLVNVTSWEGAAGYVALGLTWWQAILAIYVGGLCIGVLIVSNGIIGTRQHVPFAVTSRAPFGYYGAIFPIFSRMVIAWFWGSINTFNGGSGVTTCIQSIWPQYANLPNHFSESSGLTSKSFLSFIIFWIIQFPFIFIHPTKLKWWVVGKSVIVPIVGLATMIVCIVKAGNSEVGTLLTAKSTISGSSGFYAFMTAVTSATGSWITMAVNIGDFTRYAEKENASYTQLIFMPLFYALMAVFGAISAACTKVLYGELLYQPFYIYDEWNKGSSAGRFGAFVCSFVFCFAIIGTNITGVTMISANDTTVLLPKYFNILRGQLLSITVGVFAFAPWKVLESSSSLINFMSSYSIVLAPIAALLSADFFFVKRGKVDVPALYDPHSIYRGNKWGISWRAYIALLVSVAPVLPGMINVINPAIDIGNDKWLYCVADIWGIVVSSVVYILLHKFFPDRSTLVDRFVSAEEITGIITSKDQMKEHKRGEELEVESQDVHAESSIEEDKKQPSSAYVVEV